MKHLEIKTEKRTELGRKATQKLRKEGNVPCVLYGQDLKENIHFYAHELKFRDLVYTHKTFIVDLDIAGEKHQAILKDVSFHPVTDKILHCDFLQITDNKPIVVDLPVTIVGNVAKGVKEGGRLVVSKRYLKVKGNVSDFPDDIEINPEELGIGESIKIKDLNIDKLAILDLPNSVVVSVKTLRAVTVAEEGAAEGEKTAEGKDGEKAGTRAGEKEENKE